MGGPQSTYDYEPVDCSLKTDSTTNINSMFILNK
jgi:hypothetical protein